MSSLTSATDPTVERECPHVPHYTAHTQALTGVGQPTTDSYKSTRASKVPSGHNPNFLERLLIPIKLPHNPLFAPSLNMRCVWWGNYLSHCLPFHLAPRLA